MLSLTAYDHEHADLEARRAALIMICRAALRAKAGAGDPATAAHAAAVAAALAALHEFDCAHPGLVDCAEDLLIRGGDRR